MRKKKSPDDRKYRLEKFKISIALVSTIFAGLFAFIVHNDDFSRGLNRLPANMMGVLGNSLSWYFKDDHWSGHWSNYPEGISNIEEMNLSKTDIQIEIMNNRGMIDGMISSNEICKRFPISAFLLIKGEVGFYRTQADVEIYDIIDGKTAIFGKLKLIMDDGIMTVVPRGPIAKTMPRVFRIARNPQADRQLHHEFCNSLRTQTLETLIGTLGTK